MGWLADDNIATWHGNVDPDSGTWDATALGIVPTAYRQARISLLQEYAPALNYDEDQLYTSNWVGEMTDVPGNSLTVSNAPAGTVYSGSALSLGLLAPAGSDYNIFDGDPVANTDALHETADFRNDYVTVSVKPGYTNYVYGHVNVDSTGQTWLQYWTFYYYDDENVAGLGAHERGIGRACRLASVRRAFPRR